MSADRWDPNWVVSQNTYMWPVSAAAWLLHSIVAGFQEQASQQRSDGGCITFNNAKSSWVASTSTHYKQVSKAGPYSDGQTSKCKLTVDEYHPSVDGR